MFKVQTRLVSTIFSTDQHIANFFNTSASLIPADSDPNPNNISLPKVIISNDTEMVKNLKVRYFFITRFFIFVLYIDDFIIH